MKYYIFSRGTMKLDGIDLGAVVLPGMVESFTELSRFEFYKIRAGDNSKKTLEKLKSSYEATKKKAANIKEAIKK